MLTVYSRSLDHVISCVTINIYIFFILLTLLDSAMFLSQTINGGGFTIDWKLYSGDTLRATASVP